MAIKSIIMIIVLFAATVFGGRLSAPQRYYSQKQLALKRFKLCTTYNNIKDMPEYKIQAASMKRFSSMCSDPNVYKFKATFRSG